MMIFEIQARSSSDARSEEESPAETQRFTHDAALKVLSNQRRRFVLHFLKRADRGTVEVCDLSGQIASWENDKPTEQLCYKEKKRVQNALHQFHLPKLDDYGFVEYDGNRKTVTLTDAAADQDFYIDVVPKRDVPWSLYYLAFATVSGVSMVGVWFGIWPFSALRPELWGVFFVTTILFSSLAHAYDSHRNMRLGAHEHPPEVE